MGNKGNWLEKHIMFPLAEADHVIYLVAATQTEGGGSGADERL